MKQVLDSGHIVEFGQPLGEVERLFRSTLTPLRTRGFRDGIDQRFRAGEIVMEFDTGKLRAIEFRYPYQFVNAPAPYAESWKNLVPIDTCKIRGGMSRDDFIRYLQAWEQHVQGLGASRVEFGEMARKQFAISFERNRFRDMIHISMGPTRKTGGKGLWCDAWTAFFAMRSDSSPMPTEGALCSLTATSDEFNSVARRA